MADLISLHDPSATAAGLQVLGGKALGLARLHAAGLPTPPGVVVPSDHPDLPAAAAEICAQLGPDHRYAVRSSGVAEDGAESSLAGLNPSLLRVSAAALPDAIATVRAAEGRGPIPVLVMPFIDSQAGGVAFSTDPLHGGEDRVIRAVRGHHAGVTDGLEQGTAYRVDPAGSVRADGPTVLTDEQVADVADLTTQAAALLDGSADVEFAVVDDRVVLLQARPITSFPVWKAPAGVWQHASAYSSSPTPPLQGDRLVAAETEAFRAGFAGIGGLLDTIEHILVGGQIYSRPRPVGAPDRPGMTGPPPAPVMGVLTRVVPVMRARQQAARHGLLRGAIEQQRRLTAAHDWEGDTDALVALTNAEALADAPATAYRTVLGLLDRQIALHFAWIPMVYAQTIGAAGRALEHAGLSRADAVRVVAGPRRARAVTDQQGRLIRACAQALVADHQVIESLREVNGEDRAGQVLHDLSDRQDAVGQAVCDLLRAARVASLGYHIGAPTLAESPGVLVTALLQEMDAAPDTGEDHDDAARLLAVAPGWARDGIRAAWDEHQQRDRHSLAVGASIGALRVIARHVGAGLVTAGQLDADDDTLYLTEPEFLAAAERGTMDDGLRTTIRARRRYHAHLQRLVPPAQIGAPPGTAAPDLPDLRFVPRALRVVNERLLWTTDAMFTQPTDRVDVVADGTAHHGTPAAPGVVEGRARILMHHDRAVVLRPGEVLVCPFTLAAWTSLLQQCTAVVTETGGPLSHAAIVARELGVPAVCGIRSATTAIPDGARIRVDGDRGVVTVLDA